MHTVSKKDLDSAELETMRTSRSPTTVMTANGEVQTREEVTVYVRELHLFVTVMFLQETPAVLSLGNSVRISGILTTGRAVKNHISPEMAKELIAIYRTMFHLWFLAYQQVFPQLHLHLPHHHHHHMSQHRPTVIQYRKTEMLRLQ